MPFTEFLRASVLLFGGSGTALAVVAIAGAAADDDTGLLIVAVSWWALATIGGLWLGRRLEPSEGVARVLASARAQNLMPELSPGATVLERLWPVGVLTIACGAVAFLIPQLPAIAAGYALGVALTWRRQSAAVQAIEHRDGVQFHVERSSAIGPPKLVRTPGLKKLSSEA